MYHVQRALGATPDAPLLYRVAWIGGCVMYDTAALRRESGFASGASSPTSTAARTCSRSCASWRAPAAVAYCRPAPAAAAIPGLALAVVRHGVVVKLGGYGFANLEHDVPVTPDTVFELASVTKPSLTP